MKVHSALKLAIFLYFLSCMARLDKVVGVCIQHRAWCIRVQVQLVLEVGVIGVYVGVLVIYLKSWVKMIPFKVACHFLFV